MINKLITILIIFTVCFLTAFKCGKNSDSGGGMDRSDWWVGRYTTKGAKQTPKGATAYSYQSITHSNMTEIDRGLDRVFDVSRRVYKYTNLLNHGDYRVILFKQSRLCDGLSVPAFAVNAPDYDGTEYDRDPRPGYGAVCAAGLSAEFEFPLIVVVQNDSIIAEATRFEGEHEILYHNDRWRWQETLFHANGQGHPLLPDEDGSLSGGELFDAQTITLSADVTIENENEKWTLAKGTKICILLAK